MTLILLFILLLLLYFFSFFLLSHRSKITLCWILLLIKPFSHNLAKDFPFPNKHLTARVKRGTSWSPVAAPEGAELTWCGHFPCCSGQWSAGNVFSLDFGRFAAAPEAAQCSSSTPWLKAAPPPAATRIQQTLISAQFGLNIEHRGLGAWFGIIPTIRFGRTEGKGRFLM